YNAILHRGKLAMPPAGKLAREETEAIKDWINQGAHWPASSSAVKTSAATWWSFRPIVRPEVPKLASDWVRTPIDAFVLQKLNANGMKPAHEADRRTLLRRVYSDLTGLPPSPEEVKAFLADTTPDAYEKVVDRLLASERYGEKWGSYWLDVVRYA